MSPTQGSMTLKGKTAIGLILLAVVVACAVIGYLVYKATNQNRTSTLSAPITAPTEPVQNNAQPTVVESTKAVPANTELPTAAAANTTASSDASTVPTEDNRPVLKVAFPSFGSYFSAIQVLVMDNSSRPYRLELVPLRFADVSGNELNPGTEAIQSESMTNGTWDILLNTADVLAKNPQMGVWVADIDQSAGADKTVAWPVGKHTCVGKSIKMFNDLKGCSIGVMTGSTGEYQVLSFMRLTAMTPSDMQIVKFDSVKQAVDAFDAGQLDAVAGWTPDISSAIEAGGISLLDSSWLRNINDIIIVSNQANTNKADLVQAFMNDWFTALKTQQEDPATAWNMVANWKYGENPTNDWTYIYPGSSYEDAKLWLADQVAQASLDSNLILVQNVDILAERFVNAREVWSWGSDVSGTQLNTDKIIEPKYLKAIASTAANYRALSGEGFIDNSYMPFPETTVAQTADQLVQLPTVAQFGCSVVDFSAGSVILTPGTTEYDQFVSCASALKQLIISSDVQLLITGSAANPPSSNEPQSLMLARRRAIGIQTALTKAGIPLEKTAIAWQAGPKCDDVTTMCELDRWVHIEIKVGSGG